MGLAVSSVQQQPELYGKSMADCLSLSLLVTIIKPKIMR